MGNRTWSGSLGLLTGPDQAKCTGIVSRRRFRAGENRRASTVVSWTASAVPTGRLFRLCRRGPNSVGLRKTHKYPRINDLRHSPDTQRAFFNGFSAVFQLLTTQGASSPI